MNHYIEYKSQFHLHICASTSGQMGPPEYIGLGKGVSVGFAL